MAAVTPVQAEPLVGRRVRRIEDRRFVTGTGRYLDDIRLVGTAQMALVRSPHAHARIRGVEASAARRLPGVLAVLTGAEAAGLAGPIQAMREVPGYRETVMPIIAADRVRFSGQIVAAVVAESRYLAEDGADLVTVEYEPLPAVLDPQAAASADAPRLHDDVPGNVVWEGSFEAGDVGASLAEADVTISETFRTARHTGVPIEPRGYLARYDRAAESFELWSCATDRRGWLARRTGG